MKKKLFILLTIISFLFSASIFFFYLNKKENYESSFDNNEKIVQVDRDRYVITNKKTNLYQKVDNEYIAVASIEDRVHLVLEADDKEYFLIPNLELYIKSQDVNRVYYLPEKDTRYQNYISFNEIVITEDRVRLYQEDELKMTLDFSIKEQIIRKSKDGYYIEYNEDLFFIKEEDVKQVEELDEKINYATKVPVTVYHFIYLEGDMSCKLAICHSEKQIRDHFEYLEKEDFFTITTKEMEWFIDEEIRLPKKSILITIDDGARAEHFIPLIEEYNINVTLFLISGWYPKEKFYSPLMELASHSHNMHHTKRCEGGQGSPFKCYDKKLLIEDLELSRETLDDTEAFCFPFYEYNDHAIDVVRDAGFTTAYIGGGRKAPIGVDKLRIPRISLNKNTTMEEYINKIK